MKTEKAKTEKEPAKKAAKPAAAVEDDCKNPDCHVHGHLKTHGRVFEGKVTRKFHKRIVIEFERTVYIKKYERYKKSRTKIHARLPTCMEHDIHIGDYVKIQECRPLSKIIHFVVIGKIRGDETKIRNEGEKRK